MLLPFGEVVKQSGGVDLLFWEADTFFQIYDMHNPRHVQGVGEVVFAKLSVTLTLSILGHVPEEEGVGFDLICAFHTQWSIPSASRRRAGSVLSLPRSAVVTVFAPIFCAPRMDMHMCSASITTATPVAWASVSMRSAI